MKFVIWDLDGTLIDSYKKIVDVLVLTLNEVGYKMSKEEIYIYIKTKSVHELINELEKYNSNIRNIYNKYYDSLVYEDILIDNASYILEYLSNKDYKHIIYTHKGEDTYKIIEKLKIDNYFIEVITSLNGFKRKPDKEAMDYIRSKYDIDEAYYVGDRLLDMDFAYNANIHGILFVDNDFIKSNGHEDYIVHNLKDIDKIL